ncbi:MAG TPA: nitroreductase family protein [Clostridia bacterium]|jgi:nitroreductase
MDAIEAIKTRKSVRNFSSRPIPNTIIYDIIDCARLAPSAKNLQPWRFVVVTDQRMKQAIATITDYGKFLEKAPAIIAVFCSETKYMVEDGCAATQNILLAATAHGLGSCWVAGHNKHYEKSVGILLNAPKDMRLISLVALGYHDNTIGRVKKRNVEDVLFYEHF